MLCLCRRQTAHQLTQAAMQSWYRQDSHAETYFWEDTELKLVTSAKVQGQWHT